MLQDYISNILANKEYAFLKSTAKLYHILENVSVTTVFEKKNNKKIVFL